MGAPCASRSKTTAFAVLTDTAMHIFLWAGLDRVVGGPDIEGRLVWYMALALDLNKFMPPITTIAVKALENLGGPRTVLAAVPGGIAAVAREAGVTPGRVSQILRRNPLPREWAALLAQMIGCSEWEIYQQLGQEPPGSPYGPLFDSVPGTPARPNGRNRSRGGRAVLRDR